MSRTLLRCASLRSSWLSSDRIPRPGFGVRAPIQPRAGVAAAALAGTVSAKAAICTITTTAASAPAATFPLMFIYGLLDCRGLGSTCLSTLSVGTASPPKGARPDSKYCQAARPGQLCRASLVPASSPPATPFLFEYVFAMIGQAAPLRRSERTDLLPGLQSPRAQHDCVHMHRHQQLTRIGKRNIATGKQ